MLNTPRLCVVGGFLGAGKTTAIAGAARILLDKGLKVGIVTNDQGSDLVDTAYLRMMGLSVLEVTGGCFCCNFDDFMAKVSSLTEDNAPDIIIAEPVGSCTDLVATIFKPITHSYAEVLRVNPFTVIADPKRVARLLREEQSGFSNEINYLFRKQLEEADIILLNKCDMLSGQEIAGYIDYIKVTFPGASVLPVSALNGDGLAEWLTLVTEHYFTDKPSLDVDYDVYGRAEARLAWLNATAQVIGKNVDCGAFLMELIGGIRERIENAGEAAHIKCYALSDGYFIKAHITSQDGEPVLDGETFTADEFKLVFNARVLGIPDNINMFYNDALKAALALFDADARHVTCDAFAPGWPAPTYRM